MFSADFNTKQPLPDLFASFNMKRGLLRREQILAAVYQLDDGGCVIKTDEAFVFGDEIRLSLSLNMPLESASTPLLTGRIAGVRKYCSNFFYAVEFKGDMDDSATADIARIRALLERKVALKGRRKSRRSPGTPPALRAARA